MSLSLSQRVFLILAIILFLTSGLAFTLSRTVFLPQFDRLDHEYLHHRIERVLAALATEQNRINASTADWAYWSDTYNFVQGVYPGYIDENLAPETFQGLQLDLMLFYDAQDRLVLARAVNQESGAEVLLSPETIAQIGSVRYHLSPDDPLSTAKGIILTEAGAVLVSARYVLRSDLSGPIGGVYIAGRWLDALEWQRIATWSGQDFKVWSLRDPLPEDVNQALANLHTTSQSHIHLAPRPAPWLPSPELWGYLTLNDIWNEPALVLKITHPREVYLKGVASLRSLGFLLVIFEILLGGIILVYLQTRYGRHLHRLMNDVEAIRREGDLTRRLEIHGNDELALLANTINNLTKDLSVAHFSLQESNHSLQRSLAITQASLERLSVLRQIDQAIASDIRLKDKLTTILTLIRQALQVDGVALLPEAHSSLALPAPVLSEGFPVPHLSWLNHLPPAWIEALKTHGRTQVIQGEDLLALPGLADSNLYLLALAPLQARDRHYGAVLVLILHRDGHPQPDDEWRAFLDTLALQTAIALDNAQLLLTAENLNTELKAAIEATLLGWSRALELRDRETQGHSDRVVRLTLALGQRLGLQGQDLDDLRYGALLHDIGKIGIPDSILLKPGPLTPEEWAVMRQHPQVAYDLLKDIPFLKRAVEILYAHHERWDGSGYPRGLRGEEIPLGARIFAVVDVWDALTNERPYRPAWSPEQARAYLQEQAGILFDPQVVTTFLTLLDEESTPVEQPTVATSA
ncbi:HD domain-containing phosphohydrolase [uncultured Thermanaerothrix sp.]|uniref:HD domain-containing phosphohydrolase n=1 Tax=uncultured Thermanaerothrix sp. TaxID=1195149 RepID=UPI002601B3B6|nr:HD domain-containing phosphohydrolase [uncultured Thermanaerothrix sp.]